MAKKKPPPPRSEAAPTPPAAETTEKKPKPGWRSAVDFVGMLGLAVIFALLVKGYVADIYLIPSGSMETALHGRPDGGDRIFCSKLSYRFRPPERWEVAVFEFPYEAARRDPAFVEVSETYKGQNFVKRLVGMPGESLAIARGDIWVRSDSRAPYRRLVKPDSVQRGMWLHVYEEDFRDISLEELSRYWTIAGDETSLAPGGPLHLRPGAGPARLTYRPLVPVGQDRLQMQELPGIPDRYVLQQPVQMRCRALDPEGAVCGHQFVVSVQTHNVQGRCPRCGTMQDEAAAIFYHRRSGLPVGGRTAGRYAVNPALVPQGEDAIRGSEYHIVPDLRVVGDFSFDSDRSRLTVEFREDARAVQVGFSGDGVVEVRANDAPSRPEHRMVVPIQPGARHRLECYVVDGTVRVFVDGETAILETAVWSDDRRPQARSLPRSSGVGLAAEGDGIGVHRLAIDRDIFYYSGWESGNGERYRGFNAQGEIHIDGDSFLPMGDHAPSSFDARSWGPVPLRALRGPALFIWWPPERLQRIASP
ncbi:MAG: signal peptidase I [Planctomycetes bacterium]|nr:signal peptidase I [Planctomycetota bacterium]